MLSPVTVYPERTRGNSDLAMTVRKMFVLAAGLLGAVFAASCGQIGSPHRASMVLAKTAGASASAPSQTSLMPSPNGENAGPVSTVTYQVIVQRTGKVKGFRKVNGPLQMCPVQGTGFFSDDFGYPRWAGGYHPHQGNDIFTEMGTPIVAPFDGKATATPNDLGGLAVEVIGDKGYVYNAHLSGYSRVIAAAPAGAMITVKVGDVIGYVGSTGDAAGGAPHDHFEWHPGGGPAVDPNPYLQAACGGT